MALLQDSYLVGWLAAGGLRDRQERPTHDVVFGLFHEGFKQPHADFFSFGLLRCGVEQAAIAS